MLAVVIVVTGKLLTGADLYTHHPFNAIDETITTENRVTVKVTQKVTVNQHIKSDGGNIMANGIEDLHEKNKEEQSDDKSASTHYNEWRVFQGREDAEMLREKSLGWSSKKDYLGDYDDNERDY